MKPFSLLLTAVQAIRMLDPSTTVAGVECPVCIRTGNIFCSTAPFGHADTVYDAPNENMCCTALDETNCAGAYDSSSGTAVFKSTLTCSSSFSSKDLAVAMCPQKATICGGATQIHTFTSISTASGSATPAVTVAVANTFAAKDKCTYLIKTTKGAPGFSITASNLQNVLEVHYMEYDPLLVTMSTTSGLTDWPAFN